MSLLDGILSRLRAEERGVAMIVVMGVLLVTSTLAFAVAATAQRSSEGTVRDSSSKRALAAAETGLNIGRFEVVKKFGSNGAFDQRCVPDVYPAPTCAWTDFKPAGNGAEFSYWVSPVLNTTAGAGITCTAAAATTPPGTFRERCVTAIGRFGGVERRLQARVIENRGAPLFPFPGMLGLDKVTLNASDANGSVGTNGQLSLTGQGSDITPPATIKLGGSNWSVNPPSYGANPNRRDVSPNPFELDFYTDWYSGSVKPPGPGGTTAPPSYGTNSINTLVGKPGFATTAQRQVTITGGPVPLEGGRDYNFCSLTMNSGAKFVVPAGTTQPVRVFIDSSTRPGNPDYVPSGCPAFSGDVVDLANNAGFDNNTGKPSMLQLFVYGGGNQNIEFNHAAAFTGTIWAPQSKVLFNAAAVLTGAIAAKDIEFRNNSGNAGFTGDPDAMNVTGRWDGSYKRSGWRECSPRGNTPGC